MEYMCIRGSVEINDDTNIDELKSVVLAPLESIRFFNEDGIVTSKIKNDRLWLLGEGLMREPQANKLIGLVRSVYRFSDNTCRIDVQRIRWELNIIIGNESIDPEPVENEIILKQAKSHAA